MLNIDKLNEFGCDTSLGTQRCANNEMLYLRLVNTVPSNQGFNGLYDSIKNNDLEEAFKYAHGLKGILANLSITPILKPIEEITEHLRNKDNIDYNPYIKVIEEMRLKLEELMK